MERIWSTHHLLFIISVDEFFPPCFLNLKYFMIPTADQKYVPDEKMNEMKPMLVIYVNSHVQHLTVWCLPCNMESNKASCCCLDVKHRFFRTGQFQKALLQWLLNTGDQKCRYTFTQKHTRTVRVGSHWPSGWYCAIIVTVCPAPFNAAAACSWDAPRRSMPFTWKRGSQRVLVFPEAYCSDRQKKRVTPNWEAV